MSNTKDQIQEQPVRLVADCLSVVQHVRRAKVRLRPRLRGHGIIYADADRALGDQFSPHTGKPVLVQGYATWDLSTWKLKSLRLTKLEQVINEAALERTISSCKTTILWSFLETQDFRSSPGSSVRIYETLRSEWGLDHLRDVVEKSWGSPEFSSNARRNLALAAASADGLETDVATRLFRSPTSSVEDRHSLAAGLAATAAERGPEDTARILKLIDVQEIGRYDDPERQASLERFVADAHAALTKPDHG